MIPTIPSYNGYVVGPNGEELRTPLQQIEKNKQDIQELKEVGSEAIQQQISELNQKVDTNFNAATSLINQKIAKPSKTALPTSSGYKVLTINGSYDTNVLDYSSNPTGNSVAVRTSAGVLKSKDSTQDGENCATNSAVEKRLGFAFLTNMASNALISYVPYGDGVYGFVPSAAQRENVRM